MPQDTPNPLLKPSSVLVAALSLSIGWGIRGNYGHEFGAMLPGALTAMAVCLLSGRQDWRERIAYFAFFGAVGWGFGGSFSYMQVVGYTHSGHAVSQAYGFYALFALGFFWAALGGAGTALPAVLDRERLTAIFRPFLFVLAMGTLLYFTLDPIQSAIERFENAARRHETSIYWLDSDWIEVGAALVAILAFDWFNRGFEKPFALSVFAIVGALAGAATQLLLSGLGIAPLLGKVLVRYCGDLSQYDPSQLVPNWPMFMLNGSVYLGLGIGMLVGIGAYFALHGKFRCGASLILYMLLGWFAGFILLPVLLDLRMTPPRGDNWAGLLGMILGTYLYLWRHGLKAVIYASLVCGLVGGIGFSGMVWLKLMLVSFGNPNLVSDPQTVQAWAHWQQQNWHSFLEQSYGFVNGIGVIVALGLLVKRVGPVDNAAPRQRWTEGLAIFFALPILTYVNMIKNVDDWTKEYGGASAVPALMKAPLFGSFEFSAATWFNLFAFAALAAAAFLLYRHTRRPIAALSTNWLGRCQMAYLLLLWVFVIGNACKAVVHFGAGRLLTEWVILMNAVLCTLLVLLLPREETETPSQTHSVFQPLAAKAFAALVVVSLLVPCLEYFTLRAVYGDTFAGHAGQNHRFGDEANHKVRPLLKGVDHR